MLSEGSEILPVSVERGHFEGTFSHKDSDVPTGNSFGDMLKERLLNVCRQLTYWGYFQDFIYKFTYEYLICVNLENFGPADLLSVCRKIIGILHMTFLCFFATEL